jgi:chromosome segregation ATPase
LQTKTQELETAKKQAEDEKTELQTKFNAVEQEKQNLEAEIKTLNAQITTLNTEVENLKKDLQAPNSQVQQLTQKNKELEAKNKTTEQPKQSNGAKYTATVGMGLAAGLIAFTALELTVRLEMLVMIGIAVTSALVVGGITYAVLPSTQVDGVKVQEVNENGKSK